jgi:branched-chain amino acid transport system ATP-binding protein
MTIIPESILVFIGLTVILFGAAAFMMGQAIAETWRPAWHNVAYGLLLAVACRFLTFALFGAPLLSFTGFLASAIAILALALLAWRLARARRMVAQYPWIYERDGAFGWRERRGPA